jgi:hypothetical protein
VGEPLAAEQGEGARRQRDIAILLALTAEGKLTIDCEIVPLADAEKVWRQTSNGRRVVFVP